MTQQSPSAVEGKDPFLHDRFREYWNAFTDADHADYPIDFLDQAEDEGLIELVPVDDDALDDSFAYERGIEAGGMMFQLTDAGRARYANQEQRP